MQATFALQIIAWALGETPEQGKPTKKVVVTPTPRLIRTVHRFKALFRSWITSHVDQFEKERYPELDRLFSELYRVMTQSSIIFSNLKMKADHGSIEVETAQIISILKSTRKAIIAAQNITHMRGLEGWTLPERPPSETSHSDATLLKYERMELQNEKRATIVYRRKRAIQCCMFVALSLFQFLYPGDLHDFVAEYEDEVVRETFDRTVSIDDAKTYESLQMKGHCRARLTAPADRIPKWNVPLNQRSIIPRFVRNPMRCGAPIVSNLYGRTGEELDYINLNRNNQPQHLGKAMANAAPLTLESIGQPTHVAVRLGSSLSGGDGGEKGSDATRFEDSSSCELLVDRDCE